MKASEQQAWSKGAARVTRRVYLRCTSSQTRNPVLKSKIVPLCTRYTQTFLYVGSLAFMPPPPNNQKLCDGGSCKNISTTLPHVNTTLTDPAAAGRRPRAVCHCQRAPLHLRTGSAYPLHHSLALSRPARTHYTDTLPVRTRCTTPSRCHGQRAPTTLFFFLI